MKFTSLLPAVIGALLLAAQPVGAAPYKEESDHGKAEKQMGKPGKPGKGPNGAQGRREQRFDAGGPPPWAPAHGQRGKQPGGTTQMAATRGDGDAAVRVRVDEGRVAADIGISSGTCNRDTLGAILGGVVGGVIAHRTASEADRQVATIAGVVIGGIVGHSIGRSMDRRDEQCTGQVLERAGDRKTVSWRNDETGQNYQVTPLRTYSQDGVYCREYVTRAAVGSQWSESTQNACRNADGSWSMVQ